MDFMNALEDMASASTSQTKYQNHDIQRWSELFQLSHNDAESAIKTHLENLSRVQISDAQWEILKDSNIPPGHDKESYAYFLSLSKAAKKPRSTGQNESCAPTTSGSKTQYIFKLAPPFDTAAKIQIAASTTEPPRLLTDEETGEESFAVVDAATRAVLESLAPPTTRLTFAVLQKPAEKNLSSYCGAPGLGVDGTLPQHRGVVEPRQDQYPVPYFFYGTLADPTVLSCVLGLETEPVFRRARISYGKLGVWGGKYRALVDAGEEDEVQGRMYVVESREHEEYLRCFEGSAYEVVRCSILVGGEVVKGLTFRFCGEGVVV